MYTQVLPREHGRLMQQIDKQIDRKRQLALADLEKLLAVKFVALAIIKPLKRRKKLLCIITF